MDNTLQEILEIRATEEDLMLTYGSLKMMVHRYGIRANFWRDPLNVKDFYPRFAK